MYQYHNAPGAPASQMPQEMQPGVPQMVAVNNAGQRPPPVQSREQIQMSQDQSRQGFRRAYKACLSCRSRKIKCDLGDVNNPGKPPCARCRREGKDCQIVESKRGGIENVKAGRLKKARISGIDDPRLDADAKSRANLESSYEEESIRNSDLLTTTDAVSILEHQARQFPAAGRFPAASGPTTSAPQPPVETIITANLADTEIIAREKLVTEDEARVLVAFFFANMYPFYPLFPAYLCSADNLADTPILLAAILTLSSRYYVPAILEDQKSEEVLAKCYDVHTKLWDYFQMQISRSVWAEASTRSIGTVYAFLLFSEWNPRAIHKRGNDYANSHTEEERLDVASAGSDKSVGLSAAGRSDRMSWMLVGTAIRLAQDLGVMETQPKVYLATHMSEIILSLRMGRRTMLGDFLNDPTVNQLNFTSVEESKLNLLRIMSLAHDVLYYNQETRQEVVKSGRHLSMLDLFAPHFELWRERYSAAVDSFEFLDQQSLLFEYHYARLLVYSFALTSGEEKTILAAKDVRQTSAYVLEASKAASGVLRVAVEVHKHEFLRRAPIRWVVRIVHAAVFLFKMLALKTPITTKQQHDDIFIAIEDIAETLIEASPDEIHLASRYGQILKQMCETLTLKKAHRRSSAARRKRPSYDPVRQAHSDTVKDATATGHALRSEPKAATISSEATGGQPQYSPTAQPQNPSPATDPMHADDLFMPHFDINDALGVSFVSTLTENSEGLNPNFMETVMFNMETQWRPQDIELPM